MKYIDAEKLRAEIEKRKEKHWDYLPDADSPEDDWTHNELCELGAYKELEHIESFLDSLQQEQPEVELDTEIEMEWDSFNKHLAEYDKESEEVVWLNRFSFEDIAHYFCKLGRNQVLQEIYNGKTKPVDKITAAWLDD